MNRTYAIPACAALIFALSACAASGDYPSLARRDAERISGTAQPAEPEPLPAPVAANADPALQARLGTLVAQARAAHGAFVAARPRADSLVSAASGAARASESFSVATIALGELDSARGRTMAALADLDALYASERIANYEASTDEELAIDAARQTVAALLHEEDAVLASLGRRLGA